MKNNRFARLLAALLCLLLLAGTLPALATDVAADTQETADASSILEDPAALSDEATDTQTDEATVAYLATASVNLKVRREPSTQAAGNGSIAKGELVYVLEMGDEWCKVDTDRNTGYVQTKYLTDVRAYSETLTDAAAQGDAAQVADATAADATAADASAVDATAVDASAVDASATTATDSPETFQEKFKAYAYGTFALRKEADERSSAGGTVKKYEMVTVGAIHGDWAYVRFNNSYGYVLTRKLFKWDRIDPYAGDIPGASIHVGLAFVNHSADILSYEDGGKEVLKTVNPGAAIAVEAKDENGLYPLPYWRTTGSIREDEVSYLMKVVPWDEAQSGDLISCMTTFYAVGVHTLQYQGRNYNIYFGTSLISGLVVQPDEMVNIHDVMGPYRKSTGYHRAPIWSPDALSGFGGGCCQVNTTLYNALIRAPIFINWRKVHANVGIYYSPVGFDAAVGGGDITMIFTNTLPYPIRINFFMSDGCMTVGIFKV